MVYLGKNCMIIDITIVIVFNNGNYLQVLLDDCSNKLAEQDVNVGLC